jgi:NAD(P)H-dependent FMN reductase
MGEQFRTLGIAGSLRQGSYNRAALRAATRLVPEGAYTNMHPLNQPEVMIADAARRFDEHGNLTDEKAKESIRQLLTGLVHWSRRLERGTEGRAAPA